MREMLSYLSFISLFDDIFYEIAENNADILLKSR